MHLNFIARLGHFPTLCVSRATKAVGLPRGKLTLESFALLSIQLGIILCSTSSYVVAAQIADQGTSSGRSSQSATFQLPPDNVLTLPSSIAAERRLKRPVSYRATNLELREVLASFAQAHRLSIWIDRRIDPTTKVNLRIPKPITLEEMLQKIATVSQCEFGLVENICYFGPRKEVARVQLANLQLHQQLEAAVGKQAASRPRSVSWQELSRPADIAASFSQAVGLEISDKLPHDLLHAGEFASGCTASTVLTLVAGGFGKRYRLDGNVLRLSELPPGGTWSTTYPAGNLSQRVVDRIAATSGNVAKTTNGWQVQGVTKLHREILHSNLRAPVRRPGREAISTARMSGDISGTVENIAMQLCEAASLQLRWDGSVTGRKRGALVRFRVENKTYREILAALAEEADLELSIDPDAAIAQFSAPN